MRYKVGYKVIIVIECGPECHENHSGGMDKWRGDEPKKEPEKPKKERAFKVGDRVRRVSDGFIVSAGAVGTVIEDDRTVTAPFRVDWDNGLRSWNFADFLESVETKNEKPKKEKKPEYYNGKVVCVSNENKPFIPIRGFTVGKVYSITDGIITGDTGWKNSILMTTIEDVNCLLGNIFIPLVE